MKIVYMVNKKYYEIYCYYVKFDMFIKNIENLKRVAPSTPAPVYGEFSPLTS